MRMSHIYQPVMIKELLKRGGKASIRDDLVVTRQPYGAKQAP